MLSGIAGKIKRFSHYNLFKLLCTVLLIPVGLFVIFIFLNILFPLQRDRLEKDFSMVFTDRNGSLLRITLSESEKYRIKLPLKDISPYLVKGILEYEDRYFYFHPGVNPISFMRAFYQNISKGRIVSGASTITMQIARMLFNRPRNPASKFIEIFNAFQLEFTYSKKELLEIYLNLIPMGGNIEGVGAASYLYFGKPAYDLSFSEACILIGLPKNPNQNRPDKNYYKIINYIARVALKIAGHNGLPEQINTDWLLKSSFHYVNPFRCQHLLEAKKHKKSSFIHRMTIDMNIQNFCESLLQRFHQADLKKGIYNGAIIVLDNYTHEVLAYVGSPDYFDLTHGGQVNGACILRSPGSALKPFIYALAMEKGLVTPQSIVYDIPKIYEDRFSPVNYDKKANGLLTVEDALIHSLNIPAVRTEMELKNNGLGNFLKQLFPERRDFVDQAGLTLAIGGFPIRLEEITMLYSTLANGGELYPLIYELDEKTNLSSMGRNILDPRACYIISEILSSYHRPDMPYSWDFAPHLAKVALKTGTSFGLRDAWCIGYNKKYTIGIWMGNVNAQGSSYLIGAEIAAPVMIGVFDFLTRNSDAWFEKPEGVGIRKVCAVSGEKASPDCKYVKDDYYIKGISSEKLCSIHKRIWIRKKDGLEVCPYCMNSNSDQYSSKVMEVWPIEAVSFLRSTGRKIERIPPHNPDCPHISAQNKPHIISISEGTVFIIDASASCENQLIPLKVQTAQDADKVFWFAGGKFLTNTGPDETVFYKPDIGNIKLSVMDSRGRSDSVTILVKKK